MIHVCLGSPEVVQNIAEAFLHVDDQAVKMLVKLHITHYNKKRLRKKIVLAIHTLQGPN